jgi:hypothetical protein
MKTLLAIWFITASALVYANCTTQTITYDNKFKTCTTCCDSYGNCNTTCF